MAGQAKGKKIRNVEEALKTYEKYRADINKKINAKDRAAIAAALESVKLSDISSNLNRFSRDWDMQENLQVLLTGSLSLVRLSGQRTGVLFLLKQKPS